MKNALKRIQIEGFKTIRSCDLELRDLNALIGANGVGKSNFISFFKMLNQMMPDNFYQWIQNAGGANSILFRGVKVTTKINGILEYKFEDGLRIYTFTLSHILAGDGMVITKEEISSRLINGDQEYLHNRLSDRKSTRLNSSHG